MRSDLAILSLAVGAFGIGVTEFSPMGMLPAIAEGVDASIPRAGQLITGYAAGVMIGAPLMTLSTTRMPRNLLLVGLMGIFTLGNLLSALAPDFATLLGARVLTSLNHGAFFGVGSVVAAGIAAPGRQASAVAVPVELALLVLRPRGAEAATTQHGAAAARLRRSALTRRGTGRTAAEAAPPNTRAAKKPSRERWRGSCATRRRRKASTSTRAASFGSRTSCFTTLFGTCTSPKRRCGQSSAVTASIASRSRRSTAATRSRRCANTRWKRS